MKAYLVIADTQDGQVPCAICATEEAANSIANELPGSQVQAFPLLGEVDHGPSNA